MSDPAIPRVTLVKVTSSDSGDLHFLWSDFETVKFTNWKQLDSPAECDQRVQRMLRRYEPSTGRAGPFVIRSMEGEFLGLIGLDAPEPFAGTHELWYLIRRDRWGRGYGSAAIAEALRLMAGFPSVQRLVATAVAANVASWRLLEKNGFSRIGVIASGFDRHGVKLDLYEYVKATP